jgi:hypothetical protein
MDAPLDFKKVHSVQYISIELRAKFLAPPVYVSTRNVVLHDERNEWYSSASLKLVETLFKIRILLRIRYEVRGSATGISFP